MNAPPPAYWLPDFPDDQIESWREIPCGKLTVRMPVPRLTAFAEYLARMRDEVSQQLQRLRMRQIIDILSAAARHWRFPDGDYAQLALRWLPPTTGFSPETISRGLDPLFAQITPTALANLASNVQRSTFNVQPSTVNEPAPRLSTHFLSGNLPPPGITASLQSLLTRTPTFLKPSRDDLLTPVLLARSLAEAHPLLGRALAVLWCEPESEIENLALATADAVIAFGQDATLAEIRRRTPPSARFIPHGHKISVGLIAAARLEVSSPELAAAAALDVALWDQQGCLSPHAYYVEDVPPGTAERFAAALAAALDRLSRDLPRRALSPAEHAAIHSARAAAEFRAGAMLWTSPAGTDYTVILDPDTDVPLSPLNRTIYLRPVPSLDHAVALIERSRPPLQAVALAAAPDTAAVLTPRFAALGATRICPVGQLQNPPLAWSDTPGSPLSLQ